MAKTTKNTGPKDKAKPNRKQTSPEVAAKASKVLRSPSSTKTNKEVAASDLTQAPGKNRDGKKTTKKKK